MAELPDREIYEEQFARKFGKVARRHMHDFRELLGNPPDIDNVPEVFWQKMQRESQHEAYPILMLIFGSSAILHGWDSIDATLASSGWASQRSEELAKGWVDSTKNRIDDAIQKQRDKAAEWRDESYVRTGELLTKPTQVAPHGATSIEPPVKPQATPSEPLEPGKIPSELTSEEWDELLEKLFGPKRVAAVAVDETTRARHEGGEAGIEATVGLSDEDIWKCDFRHAEGTGPCEICEPLNNKPRSVWEQQFPDGPPSPHRFCRCFLEYANVPK